MSPLTLKPKMKLKFRLDLNSVSSFQSMSVNRAKTLPLMYGNKEVRYNDIFKITGNDSSNIVIKSSNEMMDNVGKNFIRGNLSVYGNVGHCCGSEMTGGKITIFGNALNRVASGISGGLLRINGNCRDYLCGKSNHKNEGINDGLVIITGNAGDYAIQRMRRGVVIVKGNVGKNSCTEIISGTVIITGQLGKNFANKIKRGTFILKESKFTKNYTKSNMCEYNFMPFLVKHLNQLSQEKILSLKNFERFTNHKIASNLSELFLIR